MKSGYRIGGLALLTIVILSAFGGAVAAAATEAELQSAVFRAKPAVVMTGIRADATATVRCGAGAPISVKPKPLGWIGSGTIIHPDGWVATNGHVVQPFYERSEAALAGELLAPSPAWFGGRRVRAAAQERLRRIIREEIRRREQ
jgi:S1-C subfamily serine protease